MLRAERKQKNLTPRGRTSGEQSGTRTEHEQNRIQRNFFNQQKNFFNGRYSSRTRKERNLFSATEELHGNEKRQGQESCRVEQQHKNFFA